jgi:hypothetical protein
VPAEWRSNLGAFEAASDRAIKAGLIAAAETYEAAVKERLQVGYTSGAFTTGNAANSVARSTPEVTAMGYEIAIGSTQVSRRTRSTGSWGTRTCSPASTSGWRSGCR